uniref:Sugar phosphate transporter domain-containing protein n=1 Tax=Chromera velia CCMP2878 TaxID=1169474 RepID=A0A0G4FZB8_9ALVE|eukprot:Cvel_3923.t1-p1 / transcript=Cvel_3923.t1 / gene=Cvel_3923 / organism=Chromera_velia_CCMP2878 / gene_product=GDP-fucose transporter 1, putative / transcript_product=GDP-fucose transporter 1, putative / location=Cvel_scaffold166:85132-89019(-) / protein_length=376 / sequence_SO=supercontig / SO=protein_coding / is_pseudo=false
MSADAKEKKGHQAVAVACMLFYSTVSIGTVYVNKLLFSHTFRYPIFVTWMQQSIGILFMAFLGFLGKRWSAFSYFKPYVFDPVVAKKLVPLALTFVGYIGASNFCLKYVLISNYQVARSLTLVFNVVLTFVLLGETTSPKALCACGVVSAGFVLSVFDKVTFHALGFAAGALSSLLQAISMVEVKRALKHVGGESSVLILYNMTMSAVLFLPLIILMGEAEAFAALPKVPSEENFWVVWGGLLTSVFLASFIGLSNFLVIQYTSALTCNIVGYAKACVQSLGGILIVGDPFTAYSLSGILLSLLGSFGYSVVRMGETKKSKGSGGITAPKTVVQGGTKAMISTSKDMEIGPTPTVRRSSRLRKDSSDSPAMHKGFN